MNWYKLANTDQVFHGTTAQAGQLIKAKGLLQPRGKAAGNWNHGFEGGNPSNPNLVYVCNNVDTAISYAKEICQSAKLTDASLVTLKPDWKHAIPDEDIVFDIVNSQAPTTNALARKLWTAYGQMSGLSAEEAHEYWHNPSEEQEGLSDSQLAENMKDLAGSLPTILTPAEMNYLTAQTATVAFTVPLPVIGVQFFKIDSLPKNRAK